MLNTSAIFICPGCGKKHRVIGSKVTFVLGQRQRMCFPCYQQRKKSQEHAHG